jgi:hypothetical protein
VQNQSFRQQKSLDDSYGNAVGWKARRAACFSLAALSMQRVEDPYDARQEIGTAAGATAAAKSRIGREINNGRI